ncbi:hypothetical protein [Nocardioides speluncae]|uniref:hypothetical protein n=1 Tax=Nocardioides speluncae TaxID=2670337 RepID=UPI000D69D0E3|nr:hypothetical protein [Nocardioides speluncae]
MKVIRSIGSTALAGALMVAVGAAPAGAAKPERIPFEDRFEFTVEDFCDEPGLDAAIEGVASGVATIRTRDGFDYVTEHVRVRQTITAAGVTTTYTERTLFADHTISDLGDTIEVIVLATGNSTLYGPDGKAIARGPGQVRFRVVLDEATGEELSFELIKGSTGRNDDFCAAELAVRS